MSNNKINATIDDYFNKFKQVAENEYSDISEIKKEFIGQKGNTDEYYFSFLLKGLKYALTLWYRKDGIAYNIAQGNNKPKQEVIKRIVEKVNPNFKSEVKTASHSFQLVSRKILDDVINHFSLNPYKCLLIRDDLFNITLDNRLQVTISYYKTTNKLLMQGKTTPLWDRIFFYIAQKLDMSSKDIVGIYIDSSQKYSGISIDYSDEIVNFSLKQNIGEELFNNSKKVLLKSELELLKTSEKFLSLNIESQDYSFMLVPSFRVIEGLLRRIIDRNNLKNKQKEKNSQRQFYQFYTEKNQLDEEYCSILNNDSIIIGILNNLYGIYSQQRLQYCHSEGINPSMISDKGQAIAIFDEICSALKEVQSNADKILPIEMFK